MSLVELRGLTKRYGRTVALDRITLAAEPGSVWGLLGPNGAGKSTLLRILATLVAPTEGEAIVGDFDVVRDVGQVRRMVGYVPDTFGLYEGTTVWEYLDFFGRCWGMPARDRRAVVADLLNLVDLYDRRSSEVSALSRGAKQRLALARALVHDPSVLLLDDPFASLDARGKFELIEVLRELADLAKTVLIATNQAVEAQQVCTHIGVLDQGRLLLADEVPAVLDRFVGAQMVQLEVLGDPNEARAIVERVSGVGEVRATAGGLTFLFSGERAGLAAIMQELAAAGVPVTRFAGDAIALPELLVGLQTGTVA